MAGFLRSVMDRYVSSTSTSPLSLSQPGGPWHVETGAAWSRRSGSSQTQYALQPQGAHALFLIGQVPSRSQPDAQAVCASCQRWFPRCHCAWYWHERHIRRVRLARYTSPALPQRGQTKPWGHRSFSRNAWQASSVANQSRNSFQVRGSPVQELALASGFPSSYSHVTGAK